MINSLSFENLIIWCCQADETVLRDQIKKDLVSFNFSFIEDDYCSPRNSFEETQPRIHNTLFIRGKPKICLVAHTDVCRDHRAHETLTEKLVPIPTIKEQDGRRIIQDLECKVQVGGDDRLGIAIALWTAFHSNKDIAILLTTDEEIGILSAKQAKFKELSEFELLIEIDRGNHSNQIVSNIRGIQLCEESFAQFLVDESEKINLKREITRGYGTDVLVIKCSIPCNNAINLTCGYYDGHCDTEYIDIEEANETYIFINHILNVIG